MKAPRGNTDHKLFESGAGRRDCFSPSTNSEVFGLRGQGSCQDSRESHVGSKRQQSRPRHRSPRPVSPSRGAPAAARTRADPAAGPPALGPGRPRTYPAPRCCLLARRARSRAHSRFLLPRRAAGRRRFLPDASRRPAAPPAVCRAARESRAAGSAAGGRPRRGWGCDAGLEPQAGRPLLRPAARKSLRRAPRRKPGHSARSASRLAACAKLRGHRWILSRGWSSSGFPAAQRLVTAALGLESRVRRRARTPRGDDPGVRREPDRGAAGGGRITPGTAWWARGWL